MKVYQTNAENMGITEEGNFPGYRIEDALHFSPKLTYHTMNHSVALILLKEYSHIKSALDIGAGAGSLGYFLRHLKKDLTVITLDGNPRTTKSPFIKEEHHFVVRTDLEYNLVDENKENIKFDLICSFEHLEHIQPSTFRQFLKNIRNHCHKDTIVITTAADYVFHEEDERHLHCLVMAMDQWAEIICSEGFEMVDDLPLSKNMDSLSAEWLPPHGRLATSHQLSFIRRG